MTSVSSTASSALAQYISSTSPLDINGDGVVSAEELAASTRTQDPTVSSDSAAKSVASQLSNDMMSMIMAKREASSAEGASENSRFQAMDTNGDGKVSEQEFAAARPHGMSEAAADKHFEKLDKDKTGSLIEAQLEAHNGHHVHSKGKLQDLEGLSNVLSKDKDGESDTVSLDDVLNQMSSVIAAYRAASDPDDETGEAKATLAQTTTSPKQTIIV